MEKGGGMMAKLTYSPCDKSLLDFLIKVILHVFREQRTILSEPKLKGSSNILKAKHTE